ncbi:hypothetical protein [Richelia sinica]|uniref:hypothetical protein n=1 Tax=Richelia sinica TaxID=1357545 RepID=UPI001686920A|nr:hypothetical protein [Richelia sinica]MBD2667304.1 hypothetical protein [Richelia sinica FACHB-800]
MSNHYPSLLLLLLLTFGCQQPPLITSQTTPSPTVQLQPPTPTPQPSQTQVKSDYFEDALSKGTGAATITQTSQSKEDWQLVAGLWQEAIDLLKSVPKSSANYTLAQNKIPEYQNNLNYANKMAVKPIPTITPEKLVIAVETIKPSPVSLPVQPPSKVPQVTPKVSRTPATKKVVSYNVDASASAKKFMNNYFDAIINKGYDGTSSWCVSTEILASSLFSPVSAKITNIFVYPDASFADVRAIIESSNKGGSPIRVAWEFTLKRGDTLLEKQALKDGDKSLYKYSKSKNGGWCLGRMSGN